MLNNIFAGIFNNTAALSITLPQFFVCMLSAIVLGIFMAKIYAHKTRCTKGFVATLALLPLAVAMVIIMVNGNIGAGVAVAGAFSLVRFRSVTAMCTGLTIGMGYIGSAFLFSVIACLFALLLNTTNFGEQKSNSRTLHITIPENLNFFDVFDDLFEKHTNKVNLVSSKTTNMGSMFKLSYEIELKNMANEKEFIDELRTRNGNLEIIITKQEMFANVL